LGVNIFGGILVLGGYSLGIVFYSEYNEALWGGVTGTLRIIFTISMLPAAVGYLTFCYVTVVKNGTEAINRNSVLGQHPVSVLSAIFLTSASVWMPTLIAYIHTSESYWWVLSVSSLWVTALSLLTLTIIAATTSTSEISQASKNAAVIGLAYITFHCLVIDAIVWVSMFQL
ncbi:MAG: hypothetical protein QF704_02560, partial [Anaerolineales bacterium]|nr:hypothetical protein [Anaerolineales bacterium]